jgi:hypothetical protein
MIDSSLASKDKVTRLFPKGDPLSALVAPTFHTLRRRLDGLAVSAIWIDADLDPARAGFRPSYDGRHGVGASTMMPFIGSWMSTGPPVAEDSTGGNVVLFLDTMDRSLIAYAEEIGILGRHTFISDLSDLKATVRKLGVRAYSIDDLGEDFEAESVIGSALSLWLNSKDTLASITAYAPREIIKDMFAVTRDDYRAVARSSGRVFLKTCNTETAGLGVRICHSEDEFARHLETLQEEQQRFGLNRTVVIQQELVGQNRSFNLFLDPATPDEIQVVALTDQLVEADGKTYRGSVNYPVDAANLAPVGPVIMDVVQRIWRRHPEAFGFLMCDFFEAPNGEITVYDPGIRPSGNTATAMVHLLAKGLAGRSLYTSNFLLDTGRAEVPYSEVVSRLGALARPQHIAAGGEAILPWGWNARQGRGILVGVAAASNAFERLVYRVRSLFD